MNKQNKVLGFQIIREPQYVRKATIKIESSALMPSCCKQCSSPLSLGYTLIPIDKNRKAKVLGWECKQCKKLFVKEAKPIQDLLLMSPYSKYITLNGDSFESYWNQKQQQKRQQQKRDEQERMKKEFLEKKRQKEELLSKTDGGVLLVTLKCDENLIDCIITNKKQSENGITIFHYSSVIARGFLTAIYQSPRKVCIGGLEYQIEQCYPCSESGRPLPLSVKLMPSMIELKSGGGYYSRIKSNYSEIVDLLLFSPYTKRYEITHATYNRLEGNCYIDIGLFRSFVQKYGKPQINLSFERSALSNSSLFDNLKCESFLHMYGYSASKSDGLTENERHQLLSEIVDLEFFPVFKIVKLLEFFIRNHTAEKDYYARQKWENDIKFISNYKVNPQKFLIVTP